MQPIHIQLNKPIKQIKLVDPATEPHPVADPPAATEPKEPDSSAVEAIQEQINSLFQDLNEKFDEYELRRQQSVGELQQLSVDIAFAAVAKILKQEIDQDQFPIQAIVEKMTDRLGGEQRARIVLHPNDFELLHQSESNNPRWELAADQRMPRGNCRVEMAGMELVYEIKLAITELYTSVLEELNEPTLERREPKASNAELQRFPDRRSAS